MQSPISQFNSENSAGKPNLQYQPNLSELNQKKSPLKIYNSMYNNFDYEYHTKQKRITGEMIADRSTPSNVSEQSIIVHNDGDIYLELSHYNTLFSLSYNSCCEGAYITCGV